MRGAGEAREASENRSQSEFAMRSEASQLQRIRIGPAIDQHKVGPDVAIAKVAPLAGQRMIPMSDLKRPILCQCQHDRRQIMIEGRPVTASQFPSEVALEGSGALNPPHGGRASGR